MQQLVVWFDELIYILIADKFDLHGFDLNVQKLIARIEKLELERVRELHFFIHNFFLTRKFIFAD